MQTTQNSKDYYHDKHKQEQKIVIKLLEITEVQKQVKAGDQI